MKTDRLQLALRITVVLAIFATIQAHAQSAIGTINANFINLGTNTIALYFTDGSVALTGSGSGSNTPSLNFGTISRLGTLSTGVTRATTAGNYTVSSTVNITVDSTGLAANRVANGYTLSVNLQSNPINYSVFINNVGTALSTTTTVLNPTPQAALPYNAAQRQTIKLTIPNASTFGSQLNTVMNFTATAR
jgi:hypothetical protein